DPGLTDESGLTALDYARHKLARLQARPARRRRKSPSLDENDQLRLSAAEQDELDKLRALPGADRDFLRIWWQERRRAARRVFNDPDQVEQIVAILEAPAARDEWTRTRVFLRVKLSHYGLGEKAMCYLLITVAWSASRDSQASRVWQSP